MSCEKTYAARVPAAIRTPIYLIFKRFFHREWCPQKPENALLDSIAL